MLVSVCRSILAWAVNREHFFQPFSQAAAALGLRSMSAQCSPVSQTKRFVQPGGLVGGMVEHIERL
jgi:hypothetical protein